MLRSAALRAHCAPLELTLTIPIWQDPLNVLLEHTTQDLVYPPV